MLIKFISVSEAHFQNTKIALKNQQASIQGLETQIGQLAKLISERPQGSLLSNIESNPREHLNAITIQDKEGLVELEPEPRQGIVVSKSKGEVHHSEQTLETHSKNTPEPCSSNDKGSIYEERRLQVEELDEWRTQNREHTIDQNHAMTSSIFHQINLRLETKFSRTTRQGTRACLRPCPYHGRQHGRAILLCEIWAKFFPNTGVNKLPRSCNIAVGETIKTTQACNTPMSRGHPWVKLSKQHRRATRPCLEAMVETEKTTGACDTPVLTTHGQD
ncbi:hypothetical protein GOBAR_AA22440 [Gossypium barbadense]|uniref:Uncharacterized protein n=1 Tax=Gossypium barbadense TaxID=3634 RepID=A0A2P5X4G8_GOSBA|nr:hypothetical protein GOBAR_AA22440 [Gossypium barbadense]